LKLQSADKIGAAYNGLSQMLFDSKKYAESQKVCQEFMEMEVDPQFDKALGRIRYLMEQRLLITLGDSEHQVRIARGTGRGGVSHGERVALLHRK